MRFLKLNQYESRQISLSIQSDKFKKWMGRYISSKDFYKLKKLLKYEGVSIKDIHLSLQKIFEKTKLEVNYINHKHLTKLSYTLLLFNFLKFNKNNQKIFEYLTKDYEKQISSFLESKNISIINKKYLVNSSQK